ncbi:MAG TPA: DUF4258 domain-containing protein [Candidatus Nanoarchaeia archaeon]|nr:DUF4258 domain-containing protein [Candidatus Nanoarchaeia archaeon]
MPDRKTGEITFDPHVFTRQIDRNFDIDFVEETVRTGDVVEEKSSPPEKVCFRKYHGKERRTYYVITLFHSDFIEVKTVWLEQGH